MSYIVPSEVQCHLTMVKMCASVCLPPHNLQWLDKPSLRLHIARFALCGRVSWAAFKANLRASGGNYCMVSDYRVAASLSISQCSSPWRGRLRECSSRSPISADFTAFLALLIKVFLLATGSATITSCTVSIGLNLALCWFCSFWICSLATCWVTGSIEVMSWQAWLTCIFLWSCEIAGRFRPPFVLGRYSLALSKYIYPCTLLIFSAYAWLSLLHVELSLILSWFIACLPYFAMVSVLLWKCLGYLCLLQLAKQL